MACEFKLTYGVEFSETDMAGIVHFSNFFKYMERAEHAFYRSLGFSVVAGKEADPPIGWPRVHASCDYRKPLKFEDELEIHLLVEEIKSRSIRYAFRFRKLNDVAEAQEVARGSMVIACVTRDAAGKMAAVEIPASISEKIQAAPEAALG